MHQYFEDYDAYMHPGDVLAPVPIQVVPLPAPAPIEVVADPVGDDVEVAAEDLILKRRIRKSSQRMIQITILIRISTLYGLMI